MGRLSVRSVTDIITNSSSEVFVALVEKNPVFDIPDEGVASVERITEEWLRLNLQIRFRHVAESILKLKPNNKEYWEKTDGYQYQACIKASPPKWPVERKIENFLKDYDKQIQPVLGLYLVTI